MKSIKITIWLTHCCNMSCVYCYENNKQNISMDLHTANMTYRYICNVVKSNGVQRCYLSFHGGEPFLESKLIAFFLDKLSLVNDVEFIYSITTNGTLVNDEIISCLLQIDEINISVDGNAKSQRSNRPMLSGEDSNIILEKNIQCLVENNIEFNARMTITPDKVEEIENSIQYLHDLGVESVICAIEMWNHLWKDSELKSYLYNLEKCIDKYKNDINFEIYGMMDAVESLKGKCMGGINNRIIDYDGSLYPCVAVCGDNKYRIGNVYEGVDLDWKMKLEKYNFCTEDACIKCSQTSKCAARRCVFLKEASSILFNNLCLIQRQE